MWSVSRLRSGYDSRQPAQRPSCLLYSSSRMFGDFVLSPPSVRAGGRRRVTASVPSKPRCSRNRMLTSSTAFSLMSMPAHSRPNFSAATQVVAQPQNGSSTISPGLDDAKMMRSSSASGFCVG